MTEIPPPPPPPSIPEGGAYPGVPAAGGSKNWMGVTALILGIVGLLCCWCFGFILSIGALVLGLLGKKAAETGEATNGKLANVGFILGIVGVALGIIGTILNFALGLTDWVNSY